MKKFLPFLLILLIAVGAYFYVTYEDPSVCPTQEQPVCGLNADNEKQDYQNICVALKEGASSILDGQCVFEEEEEEEEEELPEPAPAVEVFSTSWNTYSDANLGFSMKVPSQTRLNTCRWDSVFQTHMLVEGAMVPVKTIPTADGVWITVSEYYDYGEVQAVDVGGGREIDGYLSCEKIEVDASNISSSPIRWKINIANASSDEDLEGLVDTWYGQECSLGEKTAASQAGVVDIDVLDTPPTETEDPGPCWVGYSHIFKHNASTGRAVQWNIGQGLNFYGDNDYFDGKIVASFLFL